MSKKLIIIGREMAEIEESELDEQIINVDFGGKLMVQITFEDNKWSVTNAMDGWGKNCYDLYFGKKVHILEAD